MTMYYGHMTNTEKVAEAITNISKEQHISVVRLSEETGIADKTLRRRFANPDEFKLWELCAVARVLDADLETLIKDAA